MAKYTSKTDGTVTLHSARWTELDTARKWVAAFPERYSALPAKVRDALVARDMVSFR